MSGRILWSQIDEVFYNAGDAAAHDPGNASARSIRSTARCHRKQFDASDLSVPTARTCNGTFDATVPIYRQTSRLENRSVDGRA